VDRSQLGVLANGLAAVAFAALAGSILVPLVRRRELRRNRLDLAAALVFVSCAAGHALRLRDGLWADGPSGGWVLAASDGLTALVAVTYLRLRRVNGAAEDGGGLYEDARRRQHELAGQVMAANVREELATERAAAADQRLSRVFAAAPVGMAVVDGRGRITKANPALSRIVGRDLGGATEPGAGRAEPAPVLLTDLIAPDDRQSVEARLAAADAGDGIEVRLDRPDGAATNGHMTITPLGDDGGSLLVQIEDASERRRAEERLDHLATHDPLTGLPNRVLFSTRAAAAIRHVKHTGCYVGCLLVDLDHFKVVNDSLGHSAGDRVLTMVAARLADVVRPGDTVARMGGDEFCLLLVGLEHQAEAEVVARRVRHAIDGVVHLDGVDVTTSGSVGVAVALPGDKATPETLVRDADIALCRAKSEGRGRTVVFAAELREDALRRLQEVGPGAS